MDLLLIPLQLDPKECLDCAEHAFRKEWGEFIVCSVTIAVAAVVRHFEKRKIQRKARKEAKRNNQD